MIVSLRTTLLVVAALSASSVAPAKVSPAPELLNKGEPLIDQGSNKLPLIVASIPLPTANDPDLLSQPDDLPLPEAMRRRRNFRLPTLAETVATLRSTKAAQRSRCLARELFE